MVDMVGANDAERHVMRLLTLEKKLSKYKLALHPVNKFGVDIVATAPGYEGFAVEVENTEQGWGPDDPLPKSWKKGYSVPARKKKFFEEHPFGIYVKVNSSITRAIVVPMSYIFCWKTEEYSNSTSGHYSNNEFYLIKQAEYPTVACCKIEDVPKIVAEYFQAMSQMKRAVSKYTDKRPIFANKEK